MSKPGADGHKCKPGFIVPSAIFLFNGGLMPPFTALYGDKRPDNSGYGIFFTPDFKKETCDK
ncbi:hypothetical protein SZ66_13255 [Pantoea ananatis]|nr:hypothetical protein [Pantoea ananatis]